MSFSLKANKFPMSINFTYTLHNTFLNHMQFNEKDIWHNVMPKILYKCTEKQLIFRTKLVRTKVRNRHNLQLAAATDVLCSVLSGWISCRPSVHRQTLYSGKPFDPAQDQVLLWKEPVKITQVKSLTNPQDTGLQVLSISERNFQMLLVSLFTD